MTNEDLVDHVILLGVNPKIVQIIDEQIDKGIFTKALKRSAKLFQIELEKNLKVFLDNQEDKVGIVDQINIVSESFGLFIEENFKPEEIE